MGKLEGTVKTESALTSIDTNYTQTVVGCEDVDAFKKRITDTLHEVLHENEVTLIVAHGGVYWALTNVLGFENQASLNAIPYSFNPAEKLEWLVHPISKLERQ